MERRVNRMLAVGALAVAVLLVAAVVLVSSSGSYAVTAVFDHAHGLVVGSEVQAGGFKVGEVKEIELGDDGLPHVRLEIDDDHRLRRGATANLRFFSVTGEVNRYVALERGEGPELSDGATIGLARSDQPEEIDQVLATLDPGTRAEVRELFAAIDAATRGRGPDLERTLAHGADALRETASLVDQVNADGEALRTFVEKGRRVVSAVARDPASLGGTVDRLAELLRTTATRERELATAVERLPEGLRQPRLALERTRAAIPNLRTLVRLARPGASELAPFSRELRPALADAVPTLAEAERLLTAAPADLRRIDPLLRSLRPLLPELGRALDDANPIADELRVRLPDAFGFFANWADFTASFDANGNGGRVAMIPAIPTGGGPGDAPDRNLIGPSDCEPDATTEPGILRLPFDRTPGVLECEPWTDFRESFLSEGAGR